MGISVVLQDERQNSISEAVHDPQDIIASSMPDLADSTYSCVRFIDPYGDTIFNHRQAAIMIEEWDRLEELFSQQEAEKLWADVRALIVRCSEEPHTFVHFIGD